MSISWISFRMLENVDVEPLLGTFSTITASKSSEIGLQAIIILWPAQFFLLVAHSITFGHIWL